MLYFELSKSQKSQSLFSNNKPKEGSLDSGTTPVFKNLNVKSSVQSKTL